MNRYLVIKGVGAIIFAIASAIGYTLDITQITNLSFKWLPLIGFGIFFALVYWIFFDLNRQINKLLDSKPMIKVEKLIDNRTLYLKIHNDGAEGIFKAQVKFTTDDPSLLGISQYNGYWKYGNRAETKILKCQEDLLKIADIHTDNAHGTISQHLEIWSFDATDNYAHSVSTSYYFIGARFINNDEGSSKPVPKYRYNLDITISSSPEMQGGTYQGHFIMNVDGWL